MRLIKTVILFFILLSTEKCIGVNENTTQTLHLAGLCKVWGYLKYYHPQIQKGKIDWDTTLLIYIPKVLNAEDFNSYNKIIHELILLPGEVKKLNYPYQFLPKDTSYNTFDFGWMNDQNLFTVENTSLLNEVIANYKPAKNIYIKREINKYYFEEDTTKRKEYFYENNYNPDSVHALLALFRYWNVIHYFYAHTKITDENWNELLPRFIPEILNAAGSESFYLKMVELTAKINDCHGFFENYNFYHWLGLYFVPIPFVYLENKTVVEEIPDSLSKLTGIRKGDVILKINGVTTEEKRKELRKYFSCSTPASVEREINYAIRNSKTPEFTIAFSDSAGEEKTVTFSRGHYWLGWKPVCSTWKEDSIGYINLACCYKMKEIGKAMDRFRKGRAIIFDLRDNSNTDLAPIALRLPGRKNIPFANYYEHNMEYPSTYKFTKDKDWYLGLRNFHKKYRGKIIFLINENVQSTYEWQLMSLQTDFIVTVVGSNTCGSDGSATSILVQQNFLTYFTRDAVFYSDGRPTQRIGIKPDILVVPTIKGIQSGKDEVLERAIEFVTTGK